MKLIPSSLEHALSEAGRNLSSATIAFHRALASRLGLNETDHKCLDLLRREGPVTAGVLAERTGYTTGAVTGMIDRLERAGYVERKQDSDDRRRVIVTPIAQEIEPQVLALMMPMIEAMTALNQQYDSRALKLILDYMQRSEAVLREATSQLQASMEK
mgnify:CR=1 FL=1